MTFIRKFRPGLAANKHYLVEPKISIITVVYNAKNTLEQTMLSVINQTYKNIEYIIIDGGSRDGSVDIIKKYESCLGYWHSERDNGIYDAMNKGISHATGEWVIFLGADDILLNVLHHVALELTDNSTVYYGNAYMLESGIIYSGKFNKWKIAYKNICHQTLFYPLKLLKEYNYDQSYKVHADYHLNMLSFVDQRFRYIHVNRIIAAYSEVGFSTRNGDDFYGRDRFRILRERYPFGVYLYARVRYWAASRFKKYL